MIWDNTQHEGGNAKFEIAEIKTDIAEFKEDFKILLVKVNEKEGWKT